ncbi:thiamine pyrophosphate-binding protein [Solirubrobacter sp. CPCC 204708]|uniref:Thiamine pyrophosphate-binding protein n=1 Tax=Solirubrobacter deserti TaxID=2282478 RepID=A0ABT4RRD2_9ACTN|nr:thiamine pyrophosphate-binding protein [Solirubrobacter deserti]MBE2319273.1 thiamine pyrophosphate-binding protein [Solirubrobacter deserti]MDA0141138.1 thiamine pyrophosphate-binding protein [Solirubrobacter deserti]
MSTGAQVIVEELERAGVDVCFGLPGVHNLALWAALRESSIRLVGVRHEQAAAYAADGYARATGRLGVAITTTGPGAANTLGAVGEAWASRSPILVIATDIPSGLRRPGEYRGVLHETDGQAAMFAPVVKSVHLGCSAGEVANATAAAVRSATSAPTRPAYLEIATDLLAAEVPEGDPLAVALAEDAYDLSSVVAALDGARRPLIWAGGGARDAAGAVRALAEKLAAPVLTTYGAAGVLPPGHPNLVGLPPHVEAAGRLWDEADVIVAIGSDLDGVQTQNFAQPQPETLIAISLEEPTNYRADVFVPGDAAVAAQLAEQVKPREGALELAAARAQACTGLDAAALRFLDAMRFAVPAEANIVVDMCIPGYWMAGFFTPAAPRRLQVPLGWGTLGYAFPAGLGAALAGTGPTVSLSGDGGFLFAAGELATMAQEQIPLTAVIVDDGGYGMLRYDQVRAGTETFGVDLHTPDFEAMAASFGVWAETVFGLEDDFGEALARHVDTGQPSVLVAKTPTPLVPPPNTSPNWYRKR